MPGLPRASVIISLLDEDRQAVLLNLIHAVKKWFSCKETSPVKVKMPLKIQNLFCCSDKKDCKEYEEEGMEEGGESKAGESQGEEMDVEEQSKEETGGEDSKVEMEDIKIGEAG